MKLTLSNIKAIKEDPLAQDDFNQNLLAWFGFEETLRNIGYNFETLENCI